MTEKRNPEYSGLVEKILKRERMRKKVVLLNALSIFAFGQAIAGEEKPWNVHGELSYVK
ncbi:MAG: hypothetical protein GXO45_05805, partial [Aquificae bacterium]|nr:hypothetical protein [Aquificota bacterium]